MVFADDSAIATILAVTPVLRWFDIFQSVELADVFEPLVYKLPGALALRVDFTAVFA